MPQLFLSLCRSTQARPQRVVGGEHAHEPSLWHVVGGAQCFGVSVHPVLGLHPATWHASLDGGHVFWVCVHPVVVSHPAT